MTATIINGDCLEELRGMPDNSVDAVICDPPYGLSNTTPAQVTETIVRWAQGDREHVPSGRGFMGQSWDAFVPPVAVWDECLRVLKPGGHMAVFAGTRTQDLMGIGIRLAGFDIRDSVAWLYGSGMPKSHNISKAIDKEAGAERKVVGRGNSSNIAKGLDRAKYEHGNRPANYSDGSTGYDLTAPATDLAKRWEGWGTATKPAHEPVIIARKPLSERTVAANVLTWGTGAINVDATRIGTTDNTSRPVGRNPIPGWGMHGKDGVVTESHAQGRFPANVVLDRANADRLDQQSGTLKSGAWSENMTQKARTDQVAKGDEAERVRGPREADSGGASRFFHVAENLEHLDAPFKYCPKAPKKERPSYVDDGGRVIQHSTVKPVAVMSWLCKLLVPPGGTVLDPFAGSGTTGEAAIREGFNPILIEQHEPYIPLIRQRIERATPPETTPDEDLLDLIRKDAA